MIQATKKVNGSNMSKVYTGINWNVPDQDPLDKQVWEKLTSQFWLDTRFPLSNDIPSWNTLTDGEKDLTMKVFTGLTLLDTIQGEVGAIRLMKDAQSHIEQSVLLNVSFMEAVHSKSYSSVFSTLCSTPQINDAFRWSEENKWLQRKAQIVMGFYEGDDPDRVKIASTLLESFLFYSGFYLPLYWASKAKLTNTTDMVKFIIRDEAVHGFYIGQKYQQSVAKQSPERQEELKEQTYDLLYELYENELEYTQELYDTLGDGVTEDVKSFLRYNANKALMNLGYEPLFPKDQIDVNPAIMASLSLESATHDFFSGVGGYTIGVTEALDDDDFNWDEDEDD